MSVAGGVTRVDLAGLQATTGNLGIELVEAKIFTEISHSAI